MNGKISGSKSSSQILKNLNEVQQEAVLWTEGPILIMAGAGSGKTRVLTHKIAYLIEVQKVKPWTILAMTFTNKAAGEMMERIRTLTQKASDSIWMGTFHSLFARILRRECERIGYQSNFSIYDSDDQSRLIKMIIEELNIPVKKAVPRALHSHISRLKNQLISPERFRETARDAFDQLVAQVYPIYQQRLQQQNAMDFDDLLLKPIELFANSPATLEQYREQFHYLLIDEYQDTNRAQYLLIKMLSEKHRNICVVGDDDQSIYKWRGADIQNILDFEKDFPECRIFRLEQNYRSTKNILAAATSVVKNNSGRLDKTLWTTKTDGDKVVLLTSPNAYLEASKVVEKIQDEFRTHKRNFRDFAILYRTNAQSRILEDDLRNNGIAYIIVGGTRFYERKEVKDILAYLRGIVNPWDTISLKRIINYPPRNLGPASLKKIDQFAKAQHISFFEALGRATAIADLSEAAQVRAYNFYKLIEKYQNLLSKLSISEFTRSLVDEIGVLIAFKIEGTVEAMSCYENVMELLTAITEFLKRTENPTLPAFLEEVSLITDIDTWDERGNAVTLMTLHAAKGLEFPVVFITGLEEGLFPLSRSSMTQAELEEERRLFYVGATRSQEKLFLSCALQRGFRDNFQGNIPSRFINEIDPQYLEDEERVAKAKRSSTLRSRSPRTTEGIYYEYEAGPILADESTLVPELEIGMQVRHPIFGEGTIEDLEGHAESQKVTVNFSRVGSKRLVVKYANLEIIKSYD